MNGRTGWIGTYQLPTEDVAATEWLSPASTCYREFIRHRRTGGSPIEHGAVRPGV